MTFGSLYDVCMHPLESWGGLAHRRAWLIPQASGSVLEVGVGSGANLPYYRPAHLRGLHLLDRAISPTLTRKAREAGIAPTFIAGDTQALPFADATFDTVVATLVFCSVDDPHRGLAELFRVLKPGGHLLFLEHGLPAQRPLLRRTLRALTPAWRPLAGGCHLNRNPVDNIRRAGFAVEQMEHFARGIMVAGRGAKGPLLPPALGGTM